MQVTEKEIFREYGSALARIYTAGRLSIFDATTHELDAIAPYIANWRDHGLFTDKPIEWTEAVHGVVWVASVAEWWILNASNGFLGIYRLDSFIKYESSLDKAKAYAAKLIREAK